MRQRERAANPWRKEMRPARARKHDTYLYARRTRKSTFFNNVDFSLRAFLVLVAFAAWVAAIVGAVLLVGYGAIRGLAALAGTDPATLRAVGLTVLAAACFGAAVYAVRAE